MHGSIMRGPQTPFRGEKREKTGATVDVSMINTVDGRSPAPVGMVNVPMFNVIYKVLCIPRGAGFLPSTVVGELFFSEACYAGRRSSQAILDIPILFQRRWANTTKRLLEVFPPLL